ncbi:response regulator transcription factor [Geobacter sp. SVR]|uniref:response regulator n=1 Tax=Geobacter sp. SVR TaxID=2495594 RepID=UPI00143F01B0|nr:response regulator transcription factor [Geobacter sp. SVR]BCS53536.1 DNA-binding response regulator [Geobacter sp. SVR]GCF84267.1 DNA-binding response regulator [Geobacter sp. SVR]
MDTIKVILVEDHAIFRTGLKTILDDEPAIEIAGETGKGLESISMAVALRPDIIIMDIGLPDLDGIESSRRILDAAPECRVIMLSMHNEPEIVCAALDAGAHGYLLKDCAAEELLEGIATVLRGETFISRHVAGAVVRTLLTQSKPASPASPKLSPRETQILAMLTQGKNNKEIAFELAISIKTVETHRQQLTRKLNLYSLADLTRYAIRTGLISP